jgi:hypothetical protein
MTLSTSPAGQTPSTGAPYAWPLALAVTTVAGSLVASCLMPFVAIAVMAAATLPLRSAFLTVIAAWAANQVIGFTLLGFPATASAVGSGLSLLAVSLAAVPVARAIVEPRTWSIVRIGAAFVVSAAVYEVLLYGYALVAGTTDMFTPAIVALVVATNGIWCAILVACQIVLMGLAPKVFGAAPKLRLA